MQEKVRKKVGREKEYYREYFKSYRKTLPYAERQLRYWKKKIAELKQLEEGTGALQGA